MTGKENPGVKKQQNRNAVKQENRNAMLRENRNLVGQNSKNAVNLHLRLIWDYFRTNLASAMEYRVSFLTQAVGMAINDVFFLFFWWMVFQQSGNLGGYGFRDVMSIWALSASTFGLLHIVFGNVRRLNAIVQSGELDIFLLQPRDPFIHVHTARMNFSAWGDFVYAFILFFAISGWNPGRWLLFLIFTIAGFQSAGLSRRPGH